MSDTCVRFSVGGEEVLRLEEGGGVFLHGEEIANDPTLHRDFVKRCGLAEQPPVQISGAGLPEDSPYGPGTITFQITGQEIPLLRLDLGGVRVREELTEDPKKILPALREFLDKSLEGLS